LEFIERVLDAVDVVHYLVILGDARVDGWQCHGKTVVPAAVIGREEGWVEQGGTAGSCRCHTCAAHAESTDVLEGRWCGMD